MNQKNSVVIVQINDSHAYLDLHQEMFWQGSQAVYRPAGGYARIAALVHQFREANPERVVFLDNGDTLHGTYPGVETKGQALIPVLNALGLDAMTAHWETAYGPKVFKQRAAELDYPMLANNIYDEDGKRPFPPFVIKETNGLRIGITGIASNIVDETMPPSFSKGLKFTLGREELSEMVDVLRHQERADLIILISHLGFPQDMKLLSEVDGVDVCLSGHTHNRLYKPARQGKTLVIQSGSHGSFLGHLELEVEQGHVVDYRHQLIEVKASIDPDPEIAELVRQALAPYQEKLSAVVGETATALNRGTMLESTMDNFLLQALMERTGAEMAFSNGWRYGAPVVPGEITLNDLYNVVPVNPPIATVEITGDELVAMLEENLERTFASDPYNQMGGYIKRSLGLFAYIKVENPPGERIQKLFVGDEPVQSDRYYPTAFITEQGVGSKYGRNRTQHDERMVDVLQDYLARHRPLRADLRGTFVAV